MQTILHNVPSYLINLVEHLRERLDDGNFLARHRVRPQDFTRERQLSFPVVMLFVLQKTVKSIQRHLHEFLDELSAGQLFEPVTTGAWTHARAKLKHTAFIELNQQCVLPVIYGTQRRELLQRWRGHRLLGVDSSLLRLPNYEELGQEFGWMEPSNQKGATGTRYPEARLSVLYDVLNRCGLDARLESNRRSEVSLAIEQLPQLNPGDIVLSDQGFTGYVYLAAVPKQGGHSIARCSSRSFLAAQEMFRLNRAGQSKVVWLFARPDQKAECQRLGLPLKIRVRFISVRLPTGELEVLATSLLDESLYPTEEFSRVYQCRWGHETFHLMLQGRLDLENFSGLTVEAVRQDFYAAVLLCNWECVLSQPAAAQLTESTSPCVQPVQLNRAVCYHALKHDLLDLLYRDIPASQVIEKLIRLFQGAPVAKRPDRKPPKRRQTSIRRSYHYQRRVKKIVF
jgi:hypothetical protein